MRKRRATTTETEREKNIKSFPFRDRYCVVCTGHLLHDKLSRLARALAELVVEVAGELGLSGPIAFAGDVPLGFGWTMLDHVRALAPNITIDATQPSVIGQASQTKTEDELDKIRRVVAREVEGAPFLRPLTAKVKLSLPT